jgi:putative SOS response-associated peptidase YedK
VPSLAVFEPNWEGGAHVRWAIGMADKSPFAVAGLWRSWEEDGALSHSFTQLTVNAADHPVMNRFHRQGDEKRPVVVVRPEDYDGWLSCKNPWTRR